MSEEKIKPVMKVFCKRDFETLIHKYKFTISKWKEKVLNAKDSDVLVLQTQFREGFLLIDNVWRKKMSETLRERRKELSQTKLTQEEVLFLVKKQDKEFIKLYTEEINLWLKIIPRTERAKGFRVGMEIALEIFNKLLGFKDEEKEK